MSSKRTFNFFCSNERRPVFSLTGNRPVAIISSEKAGVAQLVERKLPKLEVAGSSPVARSIFAPFSITVR